MDRKVKLYSFDAEYHFQNKGNHIGDDDPKKGCIINEVCADHRCEKHQKEHTDLSHDRRCEAADELAFRPAF